MEYTGCWLQLLVVAVYLQLRFLSQASILKWNFRLICYVVDGPGQSLKMHTKICLMAFICYKLPTEILFKNMN